MTKVYFFDKPWGVLLLSISKKFQTKGWISSYSNNQILFVLFGYNQVEDAARELTLVSCIEALLNGNHREIPGLSPGHKATIFS